MKIKYRLKYYERIRMQGMVLTLWVLYKSEEWSCGIEMGDQGEASCCDMTWRPNTWRGDQKPRGSSENVATKLQNHTTSKPRYKSSIRRNYLSYITYRELSPVTAKRKGTDSTALTTGQHLREGKKVSSGRIQSVNWNVSIMEIFPNNWIESVRLA